MVKLSRNLEECESGLIGTPGKRCGEKFPRGFEPHLLRRPRMYYYKYNIQLHKEHKNDKGNCNS